METTIKSRPILFSTPMVKAERAGLKTQTRRIVKGIALNWLEAGLTPEFVAHPDNKLCPYGYPGDQIWVRETFRQVAEDRYVYRAEQPNGKHPMGPGWNWKPSIFMPKEACRIFLEVEEVRVERLQDISEEDARAEGIERWTEERMRSRPTHYKLYYHEPGDDSSYSSCPIVSFQTLWQSINGPESWESNPWVWKIKLRRVENA